MQRRSARRFHQTLEQPESREMRGCGLAAGERANANKTIWFRLVMDASRALSLCVICFAATLLISVPPWASEVFLQTRWQHQSKGEEVSEQYKHAPPPFKKEWKTTFSNAQPKWWWWWFALQSLFFLWLTHAESGADEGRPAASKPYSIKRIINKMNQIGWHLEEAKAEKMQFLSECMSTQMRAFHFIINLLRKVIPERDQRERDQRESFYM